MFIQSQQLATNSSTSNYGSIPKKRKAEHYNNNGDLTHVEQVFNTVCGGLNNQNQNTSSTAIYNSLITNLNDASPTNGNQQPFVRASTIKLLDTYQRCGQKVRIYKCLIFFCNLELLACIVYEWGKDFIFK